MREGAVWGMHRLLVLSVILRDLFMIVLCQFVMSGDFSHRRNLIGEQYI